MTTSPRSDVLSTPSSRTGTLWTEDNYDRMIAMCREGCGLTALAHELRRSEHSVLDRARRMLPVEERGLPRDRAVSRLQERLREDPAYDWAAMMRQTAPPRPVVHRVYRRAGVEGLRCEELLAVAEAVVRVEDVDGALLEEVLSVVVGRGLVDALGQRVGDGIVNRAHSRLDRWTESRWPSWPGDSCTHHEEEYERPWCGNDCTDVLPAETDPEPPW